MFGAAVRRDGSASPALRRRILFAARAAAQDPDAVLFCSGARGRFGPSEARVMADALAQSVAPERLHLDEASVDTLQSVVNATGFMRTNGFSRCVACTDRYHQPRVRMLFALFGVRAEPLLFPRTERMGNGPWLRMHLREAAAIPYDLVAGSWAAVRRARRRPR